MFIYLNHPISIMPNVGYVPTKETREKLSKARKGRVLPQEVKDKIAASHLKFNEEHPDTQCEFLSILTREYLTEQYVKRGKSTRAIAREVGCSAATVKRYLIRHDIPLVHVNKSEHKYDHSYKTRKLYSHKVYPELPKVCSICGSEEQLHVHHIDRDVHNNNPFNLVVLCSSCHARMHWSMYRGVVSNE